LDTQVAFADIQITDSHGKYTFKEPPKRVVALNWTLAEQMLELGEIPIGIADIEGFRHQAKKPLIPNEIIDVGDRLSPNLKAIRELKPDIILIGYSQRPLLRTLSNITTVIYFKSFGKRYNNAEKSRERFLEMAKLFDKQTLAKEKLEKIDTNIEKMRIELEDIFTDAQKPTLQFMVPQTKAEISRDRPLWVFGTNSMPFYAAKNLGLEVITPIEHDQFGISHIKSNKLKDLQEEKGTSSLCHVYFPAYQSKIADKSGKTSGCSIELDYQNAFGGVMSLLYLSESIYENLIIHKQ